MKRGFTPKSVILFFLLTSVSLAPLRASASASASVSPLCAVDAFLAADTASPAGLVSSYVTFIKFLVKDQRAFDSGVIRQIVSSAEPVGPFTFSDGNLNRSQTHVFSERIDRLLENENWSRENWEEAKKELRGLLDTQEDSETHRREAEQETRAVVVPVKRDQISPQIQIMGHSFSTFYESPAGRYVILGSLLGDNDFIVNVDNNHVVKPHRNDARAFEPAGAFHLNGRDYYIPTDRDNPRITDLETGAEAPGVLGQDTGIRSQHGIAVAEKDGKRVVIVADGDKAHDVKLFTFENRKAEIQGTPVKTVLPIDSIWRRPVTGRWKISGEEIVRAGIVTGKPELIFFDPFDPAKIVSAKDQFFGLADPHTYPVFFEHKGQPAAAVTLLGGIGIYNVMTGERIGHVAFKTYDHSDLHLFKQGGVTYAVLDGQDANKNACTYIADLTNENVLGAIPNKDRSTGSEIFNYGGTTYVTWATREGDVRIADPLSQIVISQTKVFRSYVSALVPYSDGKKVSAVGVSNDGVFRVQLAGPLDQ